MDPNYAPNPAMQPMPAPKKHSHVGWIISIILLTLLLVGALVFAMWAFGGMQDYKQNADKKISAAVTIAQQQTSTAKDKEFVEKEKNPYRTYQSKDTLGSVKVVYPKTWSVYADENSSSVPLDAYLHPDFVPGTQSKTAYALRVEVVNQTYDESVKQLQGKVTSGKVKVSPYKAPKMPDVLGTKAEGEVNTGQQVTMVLFPIRDKTLKISTQANQFVGDFNNIVLANLTFVK